MAKVLAQLRTQKGMTQQQIANDIGISRSTYAHYEIGRREPDNEILQKIADYYKISTDKLLGREFDAPAHAGEKNAVFPLGSQREIKIYNLIPKDRDEIFAPENIIGSQLVLADSICTKGFKAIDSSMSGSQIIMGTYVFIEEDEFPQDGEIVVAQVPGTDLLIRRYTKANDEITLIPDNSNYKPHTFRAKDVRIIGIVTDYQNHIGRKSK